MIIEREIKTCKELSFLKKRSELYLFAPLSLKLPNSCPALKGDALGLLPSLLVQFITSLFKKAITSVSCALKAGTGWDLLAV